MKTIWKYPLEFTDVQTVEMPHSARILSAQMQGEQLCIWAMVFPIRSNDRRIIHIVGTGHDILAEQELKFIDTVQLQNGGLVWHVFERVERLRL